MSDFIPQEVVDSISTPDRVETRLGTLEFRDGAPSQATVDKLYDHLDYIHGVNVFLNAFAGASTYAIRQGFINAGAQDNSILIFSELMDAKSLFLTANADTVYFLGFIDLSQGPMVVEMPPMALGTFDDMWFQWIIDFGLPGPDRGTGGKFLLMPPGYDGDLPDSGFHVAHSRTNRVLLLGRSFMENNDPRPTIELIKKTLKLYPYTPGTYGTSIATLLEGKVRPGAPTPPPETTFVEAAVVGNATSRALMIDARESEEVQYYPGSSWTNMLFVGGYTFETPPPLVTPEGIKPNPPSGARKLNARTMFFYGYTGITPAMCMWLTNVGSQYLVAFTDADKNFFDGAKTYKVTLPADIPEARFWSLTLYDNQTRSMLDTPQRFPRAGSQSFPSPAAVADADGSTSIYLGPKKPDGVHEGNWVQTVPGKGLFVILRLYSPLAPFFDKSWRPSEIEEIKERRVGK